MCAALMRSIWRIASTRGPALEFFQEHRNAREFVAREALPGDRALEHRHHTALANPRRRHARVEQRNGGHAGGRSVGVERDLRAGTGERRRGANRLDAFQHRDRIGLHECGSPFGGRRVGCASRGARHGERVARGEQVLRDRQDAAAVPVGDDTRQRKLREPKARSAGGGIDVAVVDQLRCVDGGDSCDLSCGAIDALCVRRVNARIDPERRKAAAERRAVRGGVPMRPRRRSRSRRAIWCRASAVARGDQWRAGAPSVGALALGSRRTPRICSRVARRSSSTATCISKCSRCFLRASPTVLPTPRSCASSITRGR